MSHIDAASPPDGGPTVGELTGAPEDSAPWRSELLDQLLRIVFWLGVVFTVHVGVVGQVYLLAFPVFATLLLGMRAALITPASTR